MRLALSLLPAALLAASPVPLHAQTAATCGPTQSGTATRVYASGGISAPLNNTGVLFFSQPNQQGYRFAEMQATAIYAANLWVGGRASGAVRFSGGTYGQNADILAYSVGPLTAQGTPLADACARFDRIWLVTRDDLATFVRTGLPTDDIRDWPFASGAPVQDGDGVPDNYNLAGGDLPALYGDATAWWVMHGNVADATSLLPTGVEVQVTATAIPTLTKLDSRAFVVRYRLVWKPTDGAPLTDAYVGMWSDMDNGHDGDDYVGTDSTTSLIYAYNGDDDDEGPRGYGVVGKMGASGMQILEGPRVDRNSDGTKETTLRATSAFLLGRSNRVEGIPDSAPERLTVMSGRWRDGTPITEFNYGYNPGWSGLNTTHFQYSGTPGTYWSEGVTSPGGLTRNYPSDRFNQMIFSGPFAMQPGEAQDLVVAFPIATVPAGPGSGFAAAAQVRAFARTYKSVLSFEDLRVPFQRPALPRVPVQRFVFSVGPVPASTVLRATVEVPDGGTPLSLDLFDALGRRVRAFGDVAAGTRGTVVLDVSDVPAGVYTLRLTLGGAGTTWRRVVVVR